MNASDTYTTVCDRCGQPTWYASEGPCHMAVPTWCKSCGAHKGSRRCGGTLRIIDRSALASSFAGYHGTAQRIRVRFASGAELTGTVGKTTGWRPAYLLMLRSSDRGSPHLLTIDDQIIAVQRGRRYVSTEYAR